MKKLYIPGDATPEVREENLAEQIEVLERQRELPAIIERSVIQALQPFRGQLNALFRSQIELLQLLQQHLDGKGCEQYSEIQTRLEKNIEFERRPILPDQSS